MRARSQRSSGFTLIELLIALSLSAAILLGIGSVVTNVRGNDVVIDERNRLLADARFAMQRMSQAVADTPRLALPTPDKPDTNWREHIREETVPASPPEGSSTKATAVLAVSLGRSVDLDADGFPDADNDRDGRYDEDVGSDNQNDASPGIVGIDDGGDGSVDESNSDHDDDERMNGNDEDPFNGIDDDVDGVVDEDAGADMNGDGAPGIDGIDDDADGEVDEGSSDDDDEDGSVDEDWMDVVVFYLQGDSLVERHPVPWDVTGDSTVTGRDSIETVIARQVTRFRVERVDGGMPNRALVDLTLELAGASGETVSLTVRVRAGAAM